MSDLLRVVDWSLHFENNRTKEIKQMSWVPVPTKQDGDGYTELLDHPEGAAHFGAWIAIVQVAAKCDTRGTLLRDDRSGLRRPHDAASLSRITRIPVSVLHSAISRLVDIGWLECIPCLNDSPQEAAVISQEPAVSLRPRALARQDTTEQDTTEQDKRTPTHPAHARVRAGDEPLFELSGEQPKPDRESIPAGFYAQAWERYLAGRRRCFEIRGKRFQPEPALTDDARTRLRQVTRRTAEEYGMAEALAMVKDAPLGVEFSDWHMGRGQFSGDEPKLDWRQIFNITSKVNQITKLSGLYRQRTKGANGNGSRPPSVNELEVERNRAKAELSPLRSERGGDWYGALVERVEAARTIEEIQHIRTAEAAPRETIQ